MNKHLHLKVSRAHFLTRIFWSGAFLLFASMSLYGQGTLKGVITDKADNAPLIAATVTVTGTTLGTVIDYNGEYTLPLKAGSYTIHVSYIGYGDEDQEVTIEEDRATDLGLVSANTHILQLFNPPMEWFMLSTHGGVRKLNM